MCQVCRASLVPFIVVFRSLTCLAHCGELHRANFCLHSSSSFIFFRPLSTFPAVGYCGKRQTRGDVFHFASSTAYVAVVGTFPQTTARPWTCPPLNTCGGRLREYWGSWLTHPGWPPTPATAGEDVECNSQAFLADLGQSARGS